MIKKRIFDLHLDLEVYLQFPKFIEMKFKDLKIFDQYRHGDIPQFRKSGLKVAVVNIFPFNFLNNQWVPINFDDFSLRLKKFLRWINKFEIFQVILDSNDLRRLLTSNKIGIILGVEGLNFLEKTEDIYKLYENKIRVFGLNWNIDSKFSTSLKTNFKKGLTKAGNKLIKILEKLPVVIDLAHSSFYTAKEVLRLYKKPVIFSHNGIKRIVNFEQNLDEDILKGIKEKNGLIGLTLLPYSIKIKENVNFSNWYKQFSYAKEKYKKNLAIGTDFFGFKFNENYKGFKNYLEFNKSIKKYKLPNYLLFDNAFKIFTELL